MINTRRTRRSGATAVETAIVLSITFLLLIGLIVGGMTVFHHQQVANIAQEGARWTSVRGTDYQADQKRSSPTKQEIIDGAILPFAAAMDTTCITVQVDWIDQATGIATDWDSASREVRSITSTGEYVTNTVRVTVQYRIAAGVFQESLTVRGVSEMPMLH
jgi:Flp pilus assembly protein TadG